MAHMLSFAEALDSRVNAYFEENGLSKKANAEMIQKSAIIMTLFFVSILMSYFGSTSVMEFYIYQVFLGFSLSMIGMSIGHDALHGSYSNNKTVNAVLGRWFDVLGASSSIWDYIHNKLHHSGPNVLSKDQDIDIPPFRLTPHQPRSWHHPLQAIYAFVLIPFAMFSWIFVKDYKEYARLKKKKYKKIPPLSGIISWKLLHYGIFIVLPFVVTPWSVGQVIAGIAIMYFVSGADLGWTFMLAHIVPGVEYRKDMPKGEGRSGWLKQQIMASANFAPNDPLTTFRCGGLNYQIEHHLYPDICHIHYKHLSPIVKEVCEEYDVPYKVNGSYPVTVWQCLKHLWKLGWNDYKTVDDVVII